MTEPTEREIRGAKFLVEQIDACGDNTEKKIRLVAMIMHSINDEIDAHKAVTLAAYERRKREKVMTERSRSRMDFVDMFKGVPGVTVKKY